LDVEIQAMKFSTEGILASMTMGEIKIPGRHTKSRCAMILDIFRAKPNCKMCQNFRP
jgi:hypothetical protein